MEIKFIPFQPGKNSNLLHPIPAIKKLPEWYKAKSPFAGEEKKHKAFASGHKNLTVKWCNPFGDALGFGYFLLLENDVQVTQSNGNVEFVWFRGGESFISTHNPGQISEEMIPEEFSTDPFKFENKWGIQTPPGYSTLFTHPANRPELPFLTLTGVVDTDEYTKPVNFPFIIKKNFEGIIEAGTPIAQVVPFKRQDWKAVVEEYDHEKISLIESRFNRKIFRPYKLGYWKRKSYK